MGFWGVTLENGKRYSQTVDTSFHISMAALECSGGGGDSTDKKKPVSVMIEHDKVEYLLCTLNYHSRMQQSLDLNFLEGEKVVFFVNGNGSVHLTGYLLDAHDSMDEMEDDDSEEEDDEDVVEEATLKRKKGFASPTEAKKMKKSISFDVDDDEVEISSDDDDDEDDEDLFMKPQPKKANKKDNVTPAKVQKKPEMNVTPFPKAKGEPKTATPNVSTPYPKGKGEMKMSPAAVSPGANKTPQSTPNGLNTSTEGSKKKKRKKNKNKNKSLLDSSQSSVGSPNKSMNQTPKIQKVEGKSPKRPPQQKLSGGTIVQDITVGSGPVAKSGKFVQIQYVGKLPNNQVFDSSNNADPLRFRVGKGEVVKGMDLGVEGMKVGGKRKIVIPPNQGYGNKKMGPIPANSTLTFDVVLKAVS